MSASKPATRTELKEYCLRKLGYPVIKINLSDQQIEDRIDDALQYFHEYHVEGSEKMYFKHKYTPTVVTYTPAAAFPIGGIITGGTSGTQATVRKLHDGNLEAEILIKRNTGTGTLAVGETITCGEYSATVSAVSLGDIGNQYITVPDYILDVYSMLSIGTTGTSLFSWKYQWALSNIFDLANGSVDLVHYTQVKTQFQLFENLFHSVKGLNFTRHKNQIKIDHDWENADLPNTYIVFECRAYIDPNTYSGIWNNLFVKEYLTALLMKQWGENLSKFTGINLPGNVQLNADKIYEKGEDLRKEWEDKLRREFVEPIGPIIG